MPFITEVGALTEEWAQMVRCVATIVESRRVCPMADKDVPCADERGDGVGVTGDRRAEILTDAVGVLFLQETL